jgi:hypothetical protein
VSRRFLVLALAALLTAGAFAQAPAEKPAAEPANPALAAELIAMRDADQEVLRRWVKDRDNPEINKESDALMAKHVKRLREIIAEHGWPGTTMAGVKGGGAAWTIVQHGGEAFLAEMLPVMEAAMKKGELEEGLYGTSLDRALVNQGKKQVYGTQFHVDNATGVCEPKPIEDAEHVDERRIRAGMGPLADYTKQLCEIYLQKPKQ